MMIKRIQNESTNVVLGVVALGLFSCDAKRDFPELTEESVSLDTESAAMVIGEEIIINPIFNPDIYPQKTYYWESENSEVAEVTMNEDLTGTVVANSAGETTLTFSSEDGTISAVSEIKVTEAGPEDITSESSLTVSRDNSGGPEAGEGSSKLIDGDTQTKFLTEYSSDFWAQLELTEPQAVDLYTITSGNDAPDRDPKNWEIAGSNDGENWVVLDSRSDQTFSDRNQTREFTMENEESFKYYRWSVTSNNGGGLIQVSEWRMLVIPE